MKHIQLFANGKSRRKTVLIVICAVTAVLLLALSAYAVFMGAGHKKGVAVTSEYFFSSNILSRVSSGGTLSTYPCITNSGETRLDIQIRNYSKQMVPNTFDITYELEYCLGADPGSYYSYSLEYTTNSGQQTQELTSTTWATLPQTYTLDGDGLHDNTFSVIMDCGANPTTPTLAAPVLIRARPVSPSVMSRYLLGARIVLANSSQEFNAIGAFDAGITDLNTMAGFQYNITTTGSVLDGNAPQVEVIWDADKLEINQYVALGTITYDDDADGNHITGHLIMDIDPGDYISFAFYRADNWLAATTLQEFQDLVTCTVI